jgi:integrase
MPVIIPRVAKDVSRNGHKLYENIQVRSDGKFRVHIRWTRRNGERYEVDKVFSTLEQARNFRDAAYDDFNRSESGQSVRPHSWVMEGGPTFEQIFLELVVSEWPSTDKNKRQYAQLISDYVLPVVGNLPVKTVTVLDLKNLIRKLFFSQVPAQRSAKNPKLVYPSIAMAQRLKIALSQLYSHAVDQEYVKVNPVREVKIRWSKWAEQRGDDLHLDDEHDDAPGHRKYLSPDQRKALLDAASGTAGFAPMLLMDRLGLRPREALALRKRDFNVSARTVCIFRQHVGGGKFGPTKTRKRRTIPVPPSLLIWVYHLSVSDAAPICMNSDGGFLDDRRFRHEFESARERARAVAPDFPAGATPYWLRHSWCSRMLNEVKESPVVVASVSGHDVKVLLDYYAHPNNTAQRRMMDASDDFNA